MNSSISSSDKLDTGTAKKFLWVFFTVAALACALVLITNFLVDPLRFYRDNPWTAYDSDGRHQNAGLIRVKDYNAVFVGTSVSQNFNANQVDRLFGVQSLPLTASGATAREQSLALSLALSTRPLELVIWEVHPDAFVRPADYIREAFFPFWLYDRNTANDVRYLFSAQTLAASLEGLPRMLGKESIEGDWRLTQFWGRRNFEYGCPAMLDYQERFGGLPDPSTDRSSSVSIIVENLESNIARTVRKYPHTRFKLFLPPFSAMLNTLVREREPARFEAWTDLRNQLALLAAREANIELYDFAARTEITSEAANFRDFTHYHPDVNRVLLDAMALPAQPFEPKALARQAKRDSGSHLLRDCRSAH